MELFYSLRILLRVAYQKTVPPQLPRAICCVFLSPNVFHPLRMVLHAAYQNPTVRIIVRGAPCPNTPRPCPPPPSPGAWQNSVS
jgi:hypothetical protein